MGDKLLPLMQRFSSLSKIHTAYYLFICFKKEEISRQKSLTSIYSDHCHTGKQHEPLPCCRRCATGAPSSSSTWSHCSLWPHQDAETLRITACCRAGPGSFPRGAVGFLQSLTINDRGWNFVDVRESITHFCSFCHLAVLIGSSRKTD